jgi:hypothetical protein
MGFANLSRTFAEKAASNAALARAKNAKPGLPALRKTSALRAVQLIRRAANLLHQIQKPHAMATSNALRAAKASLHARIRQSVDPRGTFALARLFAAMIPARKANA